MEMKRIKIIHNSFTTPLPFDNVPMYILDGTISNLTRWQSSIYNRPSQVVGWLIMFFFILHFSQWWLSTVADVILVIFFAISLFLSLHVFGKATKFWIWHYHKNNGQRFFSLLHERKNKIWNGNGNTQITVN